MRGKGKIRKRRTVKLVIIFGPHAVGKMTVGQALCKETGLKLFHNHMTIEPVYGLFENDPAERSRLTELFREEIFKSFLKGNEYGMVFTFMWAFNAQQDWAYIDHVESLFKDAGADVYYVELTAEESVRRERNKTENRLLNKPSKRDIAFSDALFTRLESKYRLNSLPGELDKENYIRIDNTYLSPEEAARVIRERFVL